MTLTLRLALAAALAASPALAQTEAAPADPTTGAPLETPAAATWNETIRGVFFTDEPSMTLLPEADSRARWADLSAEDQRIVRRDCDATRSGAVGGAAPAEDVADTTAAAEEAPPVTSEDTGAAGSAVAAGKISLSHLVQICALVDAM